MVEGVGFGVGGQRFVVERVGRGAAKQAHRAFVELDSDHTGDRLLRLVHEGVERLAHRREPGTVVDDVGVVLADVLLVLEYRLFEREPFEFAVGEVQNRGCRSFVDFA